MIAEWFTPEMTSWEDQCAAIVGTWLAEARRIARYSQDALGGRVGVSQSTISRIEHGLVPGAHLRTIAPILVFLEAELGDAIRSEAIRRRRAAWNDPRSRMADERPDPAR
jgi:transcriptional regulator with XRE-family HTH domain